MSVRNNSLFLDQKLFFHNIIHYFDNYKIILKINIKIYSIKYNNQLYSKTVSTCLFKVLF